MILYLLYLRDIILFSVISYHGNVGPGFSNNTKLHSLRLAHFSPSKSSFGLFVGHCVINHCCKMCLCFCNALLRSYWSYNSESVNSCPALLKLMFWAQTQSIFLVFLCWGFHLKIHKHCLLTITFLSYG